MNQAISRSPTGGRLLAIGVVTAVFAFAFTCGCNLVAKKITIGSKDEVRYGGTATAQEARALGESLKTQGYFQDNDVIVVLTKGPDGTIITFIVVEGTWNNDNLLPVFEQMVRTAGPAVGGLPIKLRFASGQSRLQEQTNSPLDIKKEILVH